MDFLEIKFLGDERDPRGRSVILGWDVLELVFYILLKLYSKSNVSL